MSRRAGDGDPSYWNDRTMVENLMVEGLIDFLSSGWILSDATIGDLDTTDEEALVFGLVAEMLLTGLGTAGSLGKTGFEPWDCTAAEAVERIVQTWVVSRPVSHRLGDEAFWISVTEKGERIGRDVLRLEAESAQGDI